MFTQQVTWDGSTDTWNSATEPTWDSYTIDISELALSETLQVSEEMTRADIIYELNQYYKLVEFGEDVALSGTGLSVIFQESIGIEDSAIWGYHVTAPEALSIVDAKVRELELNLASTINVVDNDLLQTSFNLDFDYSINIKDALLRNNHIIAESFTINFVDDFYRPLPAVLSDMSWYSTPLTNRQFEQFVRQGHKEGYSRYTTFLQGEYDYQDASIRTKIINTDPNIRAELEGLLIEADIPDVIDSGTGVINPVTIDPVTPGVTVDADTGLNILYSRKFYIDEPHISAMPKGSAGDVEVLTPVISKIPTKEWNEGFNVKLLDTATGTYKLGTFTWSARGY